MKLKHYQAYTDIQLSFDLEQPINQGLNAVALFPHVDDKKDEEYFLLIISSLKLSKESSKNIQILRHLRCSFRSLHYSCP